MNGEAESDYSPERSLWAAVISQAIKDWRVGYRVDGVYAFFNGEWFKQICGMLDLNWREVRDRVMKIKTKWRE